MHQDTGEKAHDPLPEALRRSRQQGEVAQSRELSGAVAMIAGVVAFAWRGPTVLDRAMKMIRLMITLATDPHLRFEATLPAAWQSMVSILLAVLPPLLISVAAGALTAFCQVGPLFTFQTMTLKASHLNPIAHAKENWGPKAIFEGLKCAAKIAIIASTGYFAIRAALPEVVRLSKTPTEACITIAARILRPIALCGCISFLGFGAIDLLVQRHRFRQRNKVSFQGLKEQFKEYDGDPEIRQRQREKSREIAAGLSEADQGNFAVANPTHVCCILRMDPKKESAPRLIAKGRGRAAKRLKAIARKKGMYIEFNRPLAWALLEVPLQQEIPIALYEAASELVRYAEAEYRNAGETPPWASAFSEASSADAAHPAINARV